MKTAKIPTPDVLFVCAECGGGKSERRRLKTAVKEAGRKHEVRVVASGCLDICPKHGVTVAHASRSLPTSYAIVDRETSLDALLAPTTAL